MALTLQQLVENYLATAPLQAQLANLLSNLNDGYITLNDENGIPGYTTQVNNLISALITGCIPYTTSTQIIPSQFSFIPPNNLTFNVSTPPASFSAVTPNAVITVEEVMGTYPISLVSSAFPNITAANFTVTKNSTGNITISWNAALFPTPIANHVSWPNGSASVWTNTATGSGNATVYIFNASGAVNSGFVLQIN